MRSEKAALNAQDCQHDPILMGPVLS